MLWSVSLMSPVLKRKRHVNFLQDLAAAIFEVDADKFTDVVKEFDSMSRLVSLVCMMKLWILFTAPVK